MASTESAAAADQTSQTGGQPILARHRQQQPPSSPSGQLPANAGSGWFPLGYKEGWSQWWAGLSPAVTEHKVLSFVPFLQQPPTQLQTGTKSINAASGGSEISMELDKSQQGEVERTTSAKEDPYGPRMWHSEMVQLQGKNRALNEFSVERLGEAAENNLVILHGYGAGLGFFYKNFEALSRVPNWKLYALDMLGMGRSTRPPFKIHAKSKEDKIREAESWFVDALEEWRIKRGIDKMTLVGHSLGGYMSVCYALKYPGHLNKLILASPVGIPEDPYAMNEEMPDPADPSLPNGTAQQSVTHAREANGQETKPPRRPVPKWLHTLWDANVSPFSIVRLSGPLGPRLVSGWTSRRFSHLPADEAQALHDYSYSLFRQRGSGEYALAYVLAPGAFARSPLIRRIHGVGRQFLEDHKQPEVDGADRRPSASLDRLRENGVPIVFMYGDHDWMDVGGGLAAKELLDKERDRALANASEEEKQRENGSAKVTIIRKAGHHVYLDGWKQFNDEVLAEMKDVEKRQKRLAAFAHD